MSLINFIKKQKIIYNELYNKYKNDFYPNPFNELLLSCNDDISTERSSKSVKLMLAKAKLEFLNVDMNRKIIPIPNVHFAIR